MKKVILIVFCSIFLLVGTSYGQLQGQLRFSTNYGDETFDMGLRPVQDRAEIEARIIITHVPNVIGAFGIEYLGSLQYYNDFNKENTDNDEHAMTLYWDKTWGSLYGKLYTKLAWMFQTYYEKNFDSGEFVQATIGLVVPSNPYISARREYSTYKFNEFRFGLEQFFSLTSTNTTRLYLAGSLNYINFDENLDETIRVNVTTDGQQTVVVDRVLEEGYSNWHSWRLTGGFSWRIRSGMELLPSIELVGGLNKDARDEMMRLGDTDLLWIPKISFYYIF